MTGQYKVLLPDGRLQTVTYIADENGYRAKVDYTPARPGEATTAGLGSPVAGPPIIQPPPQQPPLARPQPPLPPLPPPPFLLPGFNSPPLGARQQTVVEASPSMRETEERNHPQATQLAPEANEEQPDDTETLDVEEIELPPPSMMPMTVQRGARRLGSVDSRDVPYSGYSANYNPSRFRPSAVNGHYYSPYSISRFAY